MIQLSKSGLFLSDSAERTRSLRARFESKRCVKVTNFLAPDFAEFLRSRIDGSSFYVRDHDGIALELCMATNNVLGLMQLLLNNPNLFRRIEQITGCARIESFDGRVYRMLPGSGHYDTWHGDVNGKRLIGLSVNLSGERYSGGTFEIADDSGTICRMPNTGFGDAILFQIAHPFRHRVTSVRGSTPKTAFAGWFENRPHPHAFFGRFVNSALASPPAAKSVPAAER